MSSENYLNKFAEQNIFSQRAVESLKQNTREDGKICCLVRDKEIKLTPEECVRQLFAYDLINKYGYTIKQICFEYPVTMGREQKRADIVVLENNTPYIIVETKKPKLNDGKQQLKSYCSATGAPIGVWTNGEQIIFYRKVISGNNTINFESIPGLPSAGQSLKDYLAGGWTLKDLIENDKLTKERISLKDLIKDLEDEVLANSGEDVFEEVFKLIYTKLYDEKASGEDSDRKLLFRNYGDSDKQLKEVISNLYDDAKKEWPGIFQSDDSIKLTPSHLAICVAALQDVKLFNSNLEVIDDAFEYLMNKSQKGEKGQYFTPRYIIDMCVKMMNPQENEKIIDPAAGSCGFPLHATFHVWQKILKRLGKTQDHLFTAKKKPQECANYVRDNVFAIDFDEKATRIAKTLNLIAGDGKTNVFNLNTLDYANWVNTISTKEWSKKNSMDGWNRFENLKREKNDYKNFNFDIVLANPPFAGEIKELQILSKYEIAHKEDGKQRGKKLSRDILFIERCLCLLKPGGRMAIVLPQGRFNNVSEKYVRDFIVERCRILAVVGLHENVFKPHTGTKTSVMFVQKWDDKLCPKVDDYNIFFATMVKPTKDQSGDKIYLKDKDGKIILDSHGHMIVDHDLFNHEGLTEDGIAEAFIEFAKEEKLSFFKD